MKIVKGIFITRKVFYLIPCICLDYWWNEKIIEFSFGLFNIRIFVTIDFKGD